MIKARFGARLDRVDAAFPFLFWRPLNPNLLSLLGAAGVGRRGVGVLAGHLRTGGWLMIGGGFFDLVDGAVARHNIATTFGAFLDSTLDRLVDMAVLAGMMLYYAAHGEPGVALVGGRRAGRRACSSPTRRRGRRVVMGRIDGGLLRARRAHGHPRLRRGDRLPARRARCRRRRRHGHSAPAHRDRPPRDGEDRRGGAGFGGPHAVTPEQRGERGFIVVDKRGGEAPEAPGSDAAGGAPRAAEAGFRALAISLGPLGSLSPRSRPRSPDRAEGRRATSPSPARPSTSSRCWK